MNTEAKLPEINMDPDNLYRDESYTDQQSGTLRHMIPVTIDGAPDASREAIFVGQAQVMTPVGAVPLSFQIEATNLAEAIAGYGAAAQIAVEQTARELEEMRRQQASQIVVPKGPGGAFGAPGGKIQMP